MLSPRQLAFYEGLAQNRAHSAVLRVLQPLLQAGGLSRAALAKKINRNPSQVTRWLGSPGNWTLQTLGILLGALGYVPVITVQPINERVATNYVHPAAQLGNQFVDLSPKQDDNGFEVEEVILDNSRKLTIRKSTNATANTAPTSIAA